MVSSVNPIKIHKHFKSEKRRHFDSSLHQDSLIEHGNEDIKKKYEEATTAAYYKICQNPDTSVYAKRYKV